MLKKTINFLDLEGNKVKEDIYLHLTPRELTKIQSKYGMDDLQTIIEKALKEKNGALIFDLIDTILVTSYGVKSDDNKSFIKTKEQTELFECSLAYAELFEEVMNYNERQLNAFMNAVVPKTKQLDKK